MARISTHVLDIAHGRPAAGVAVELRHGSDHCSSGVTNIDGRTDEPLLNQGVLSPGSYELTFQVGDYFRAHREEAFFETITISFIVKDPSASYHVPLLLTPHGYSTYRGS